jgi:hypothetical protein
VLLVGNNRLDELALCWGGCLWAPKECRVRSGGCFKGMREYPMQRKIDLSLHTCHRSPGQKPVRGNENLCAFQFTIAPLQLLVALTELPRNRKWSRRCGGGWTSSQIVVAVNRTLVAKHHDRAGGCPSLYLECLRALTTKPKKKTLGTDLIANAPLSGRN